MGSIEEERPLFEQGSVLLQEVKLYAEDGSVDIHGNPPLKQKTGNWKACPFILGNECCERLAYYGIAKNLVTYFTTKLHETNVSAARHVMIWQGKILDYCLFLCHLFHRNGDTDTLSFTPGP